MSRDSDQGPKPSSLDPEEWGAFRRLAHQVLDECIDHLEQIRARPWKPFPKEDANALGLGVAEEGIGVEATARQMLGLLPYGSGNTHPSFFGWVQGTGNAAGLLAELVAASMNSNCGGRNHAAVYIERDVIRWCKERFGMPDGGGGVLVTGTSQATVLGLAVARQYALGDETRRSGIVGTKRLVAYAVEGVHQAVTKGIELIGLGSDALRLIPRENRCGGMCPDALREQIAADRANGATPFCVVATAGSVDTGSFDPIDPLADVCEQEGMWLHIDGAYGAWLKIAEKPWSELVKGMERADSIALDFHKWMFVQYDCGLILVRDEALQRAVFSSSAPYLRSGGEGLSGGRPWFADYGTDLSRGFRALKAWATIRAYGRQTLGRAISENCRQASLMGESIKRTRGLELVFPVIANVCCFSVASRGRTLAEVAEANRRMVTHFQDLGEPIFSLTQVGGKTLVRAAIVNHRTTDADVEAAVRKLDSFSREQSHV